MEATLFFMALLYQLNPSVECSNWISTLHLVQRLATPCTSKLVHRHVWTPEQRLGALGDLGALSQIQAADPIQCDLHLTAVPTLTNFLHRLIHLNVIFTQMKYFNFRVRHFDYFGIFVFKNPQKLGQNLGP